MSHATEDQSEVIAFLSDSASYSRAGEPVTRYETHGSIVFLVGERAYKLKRAVRFPYMDFSTVARRRAMCERELSVNRRTAPMLYLDSVPIVKTPKGTLRFGTASESETALDWVVVMKRFPQESLLENLRRSGRLEVALIRDVAESIAGFHGEAEVMPGRGGSANISAVIAENEAALAACDGVLDLRLVASYGEKARAFHRRVSSLLESRREQGFVRRCHGDLHLNNICVLENRPVLFDAIEFNDEFSCIDVLYDIAFLLMDLHRHGLRRHANALFNRYLELTGDYDGLTALPLFLSCRAAIRAHVAIAAAEATGNDAQVEEGRRLLQHAVDYLEPEAPRLVAVGGLSGTGKSTLAYGLAPLLGASPGAAVVRSDIIRKRLMGVAERTRLPETAYASEVTRRVYTRVDKIAASALAAGYSVIADAVFGLPEETAQIAGVARTANVPFDGLWLEGPSNLLEDRIAARRDDASDATAQVLQAQLRFVTKPQDWRRIDAGISRHEAVTQAARLLGAASDSSSVP